jgi:hypothetical protein
VNAALVKGSELDASFSSQQAQLARRPAMSAVVTANVTSLLIGLGFDQVRRDVDQIVDELVIDTFDMWRNSDVSSEMPVMGCACFREPELEPLAV